MICTVMSTMNRGASIVQVLNMMFLLCFIVITCLGVGGLFPEDYAAQDFGRFVFSLWALLPFAVLAVICCGIAQTVPQHAVSIFGTLAMVPFTWWLHSFISHPSRIDGFHRRMAIVTPAQLLACAVVYLLVRLAGKAHNKELKATGKPAP